MAVMTITWVTKEDLRVCPVCRPLHNNVWAFDTEREAFPQLIYSPVAKKAVWDSVRDVSIAHVGFSNAECRCELKVEFVVQEIEDAIRDKLTQVIQMKVLPPISVVTSR